MELNILWYSGWDDEYITGKTEVTYMGRNNRKSSSDWEVPVQSLVRRLSCSKFLPIRLERNMSVEAWESMNKLCSERNITKKRAGWTHVLHGQLPDTPFSLFLTEFQSLALCSPLALLWLKTSSLPNSVFSPATLPSLCVLPRHQIYHRFLGCQWKQRQ